jgi:hypothetical protein
MSDGQQDGQQGGWPDPAQGGWNPPGGNYPNPEDRQTSVPPPAQQVPPAQYPQGQYPPPSAAEPKRRNRGCLLALVLVPLLIVLGIGGCTAAIVLAVRPPIDATNRFVANLDNGDFDAAYESLCAAERESVPRQVWIDAQVADLGGEITGYQFTSGEVNSAVGSQTVAVVTGTIEVDGVERAERFRLVDEDGDWKICS